MKQIEGPTKTIQGFKYSGGYMTRPDADRLRRMSKLDDEFTNSDIRSGYADIPKPLGAVIAFKVKNAIVAILFLAMVALALAAFIYALL